MSKCPECGAPVVLDMDCTMMYQEPSHPAPAKDGMSEREKELAYWLQWCLANCDDSPEYNFGTEATEKMRALLAAYEGTE